MDTINKTVHSQPLNNSILWFANAMVTFYYSNQEEFGKKKPQNCGSSQMYTIDRAPATFSKWLINHTRLEIKQWHKISKTITHGWFSALFLLFLFTNFFYQTIKKCLDFTPPYNSPSVAWNTRKCRCNEFARVQRPEEFFFRIVSGRFSTTST
jgi:hypothetical protein